MSTPQIITRTERVGIKGPPGPPGPAVTFATRAWPSDGNYTAVVGDYSATILELTGGPLTAQRDIVVPLATGRQWTIANLTGGGQSIRIIGPTGAGVVIGNGKRAIVYPNGTDVVRVTADV